MKSNSVLLTLLVLGTSLSNSCIVSETSYSAVETPVVRSTKPVEMWNLVTDGVVVGSVVLFASDSDRFFSVRNEWQQDIGMIDAMGRAFAFVPHQKEAEWVSSGSVVSGAAKILGIDGDSELHEVPLPADLVPATVQSGSNTD